MMDLEKVWANWALRGRLSAESRRAKSLRSNLAPTLDVSKIDHLRLDRQQVDRIRALLDRELAGDIEEMFAGGRSICIDQLDILTATHVKRIEELPCALRARMSGEGPDEP